MYIIMAQKLLTLSEPRLRDHSKISNIDWVEKNIGVPITDLKNLTPHKLWLPAYSIIQTPIASRENFSVPN